MLGVGMFCSLWIPLALAEVTSYLHFIMDSCTACCDAQKIKKPLEKGFIAFCIATHIIKNALWVVCTLGASLPKFFAVLGLEFFCVAVEWVILVKTGRRASLLKLTVHQNQAKVNDSLLGFRPAYYPID